MSRPARFLLLAIGAGVIALEIAAYFTYRNTVDGQSAVLLGVILVYAALAVLVVGVVDATVRRLLRR
jgi:hypothetical protein